MSIPQPNESRTECCMVDGAKNSLHLFNQRKEHKAFHEQKSFFCELMRRK